MTDDKKLSFGKLVLVSVVVTLIVIALVLAAGALGVGAELCFLGIIVWAKCFQASFKALDILKVWTGALTGLLVCVAFLLISAKFGTDVGGIVLLVLILVQVIFDIGSLSPWVVNASTPFFLTVCILMATRGSDIPALFKDFGGGFALGGLSFIIIGLILSAAAKKKEAGKA